MPKSEPFMYDCASALDDARTQLEELGQEMRDWFDNMPENLQGGDKGCAVDEAANSLESATGYLEDAPECATKVPQFSVEGMTKKRPTRAYRCGYACSIITSTIEAVQTYLAGKEIPEDVSDELEEWVSSLQACLDEAEGVTFPGMFG